MRNVLACSIFYMVVVAEDSGVYCYAIFQISIDKFSLTYPNIIHLKTLNNNRVYASNSVEMEMSTF